MQISFRAPTEAETRQVEGQSGRFYFSRFTELLLRKHGVIPAVADGDVPGPENPFRIVPRGLRLSATELRGPCLIEGPIDQDTAAQLGVTTSPREAPVVELLGTGGRSLGSAAYTRWRLRPKHPETAIRGERYELQAEDPRWHATTIGYQVLEPGPGWRAVLWAAQEDVQPPEVVGVSDGSRLLLGVPVLDLLVSLMAWPPFPDGYNGTLTPLVEPAIESWLIGALRDLALHSTGIWARIARWPAGARWAHTIRHDYDRLLTDRQLSDLIEAYGTLGARSVWYLLRNRAVGHQARVLRRAGHEVGLHTCARTYDEFEDELRSLEAEAGLRIRGATAHGGRAIGYLGGRHIAWSDGAGLLHGEVMGRLSTLPFVGLYADREGLRPTKAILLATHRSLDAGVGPDDHYLDAILDRQAAAAERGDWFMLMNHPDVHREQLLMALREADLGSAWRCTPSQAARWTRWVKYGASWEYGPSHTALVLSRPSPWPVVLEIHRSGEPGMTFTLPPMETRLILNGVQT